MSKTKVKNEDFALAPAGRPDISAGAWNNWETLISCKANLAHASSVEDLRGIIAYAKSAGKTIRVSGGNGEKHEYEGSYSGSPVVVNEGEVIVFVRGLNSGRVHSDGSGRITAGAGMTLDEFDKLALENDLCLLTEPVPKFIQIGGAVTLSCHGCGNRTGTISDQIVAMEILTHDGKLVTISKDDKNRDRFRAAQVNLGALGIIVSVTLQCVPKYKLRATDEWGEMDSTIENIEKLVGDHEYVELLWFPFTKNVWIKKWDSVPWSTADVKPPKSPTFREKVGIGISNALTNFAIDFPWFTPPILNFLASTTTTGTVVAPAPDIFHYATVFPRELYDLSYCIPNGKKFNNFKKAWKFAVDAIYEDAQPKGERGGRFSWNYAAGGKFPQNSLLHARFIKNSDGFLAPAVCTDKSKTHCMFEAITYVGADVKDYYDKVEQYWLKRGGRPHWGKTFDPKQDFAAIYGKRLEKFNAVRKEMDPDGLFLNDFLRHVFCAKTKRSQ